MFATVDLYSPPITFSDSQTPLDKRRQTSNDNQTRLQSKRRDIVILTPRERTPSRLTASTSINHRYLTVNSEYTLLPHSSTSQSPPYHVLLRDPGPPFLPAADTPTRTITTAPPKPYLAVTQSFWRAYLARPRQQLQYAI